MKKELLLTVSAAAMVFGMAQTTFAAKKSEEELAIVRCSNNGNGNGDEVVTFGGPPGSCEKFQEDNNQDAPGNPGQGTDSDPN